jgi:hypothetical protein
MSQDVRSTLYAVSLLDARIKQNRIKYSSFILRIIPLFNRIINLILIETAMGIKMDSQTNSDKDYVRAIHQWVKLTLTETLI